MRDVKSRQGKVSTAVLAAARRGRGSAKGGCVDSDNFAISVRATISKLAVLNVLPFLQEVLGINCVIWKGTVLVWRSTTFQCVLPL